MNIDNLINLPKNNFGIKNNSSRSNSEIIGKIFKKYYPKFAVNGNSFTGSSDSAYFIEYDTVIRYNTMSGINIIIKTNPNFVLYDSVQDFIKKHSEPQIVTDYSIF